MKTRKLLIIVLIVTLLIVYYLIGMDYLKQLNEHEALAAQITEAAQTLEGMPPPPDDIEQRLATAQASLDAVKGSFTVRMSSTGIINTILKLADNCQVKVIPLVTQAWTNEGSDNYSYSVFRLNVAITGTFSQLVIFLNKLENIELKTLIVEDLSVTRVNELSEEESAPEGTIPVNASLDLAVYTQSATIE